MSQSHKTESTGHRDNGEKVGRGAHTGTELKQSKCHKKTPSIARTTPRSHKPAVVSTRSEHDPESTHLEEPGEGGGQAKSAFTKMATRHTHTHTH